MIAKTADDIIAPIAHMLSASELREYKAAVRLRLRKVWKDGYAFGVQDGELGKGSRRAAGEVEARSDADPQTGIEYGDLT